MNILQSRQYVLFHTTLRICGTNFIECAGCNSDRRQRSLVMESWKFRSVFLSFSIFGQRILQKHCQKGIDQVNLEVRHLFFASGTSVLVFCDTAKVLRIVVTVLAGAALGSTTGWLICRRRNLSIGGKQDWVSALGCCAVVLTILARECRQLEVLSYCLFASRCLCKMR